MDRAILFHDEDDATVDIRTREGNVERTIRIDGRDLGAKNRWFRSAHSASALQSLPCKARPCFVAKNLFGEQFCNVDIETDELALIVDESEGRRFAGDADDDFAAGADFIELRFTRRCGRLLRGCSIALRQDKACSRDRAGDFRDEFPSGGHVFISLSQRLLTLTTQTIHPAAAPVVIPPRSAGRRPRATRNGENPHLSDSLPSTA